jgi:Flp pilus assembly protein TadG
MQPSQFVIPTLGTLNEEGHTLFLNLINRFRRDKAGNLAITFAAALVPLLGAVGASIDYSLANAERTRTQAVLDSAVLAGAQETTSTLQINAASTFFSAQITNPWGTKPTASFSVDSTGKLTGTASGAVNSQFIKLVGFSAIPVSATSSAVATPSSSSTPAKKICILLTNSTNSQSLLVNSGANLTAPNCDIDVDSTSGTAAMINWGSTTTLDVNKVCIKGGATQNGGTNPVVSTNCAAVSNPYVNTLPSVTVGSCTTSNQTYNPGNVTINPGVYCGSTNFNGNGTLTLNPGLYIIKSGTMTFNSGWTVTGTGVTFYLVDQNSTLQFNGNVTTNISAPTSGTYANILMFEPDSLSSSNLPIDGTSGSNLQGLIYLPSRNVTINSVSNVNADLVTMVFSTLTLDALNWNIDGGVICMSEAGVVSWNGCTTSTPGVPHLTN